MPGKFTLAIEISNPSSGPRGDAGGCLAGPGVALGVVDVTTGKGTFLGAELLGQGPRHDDDLMPAIDRVCRSHGAVPADLGTIAVSIGPGGYTSLRIAVATAKMIAEATGARVVPIPSAQVAAERIIGAEPPILVCLASKNTTVHATMFASPEQPGWVESSRVLGEIDAAAMEQARPRTVVGDRFLPDAFREAAARIGAPIVEPIFAAESVFWLSVHAAAIDAVQLAPTYPREPEAVTKWRERLGR